MKVGFSSTCLRTTQSYSKYLFARKDHNANGNFMTDVTGTIRKRQNYTSLSHISLADPFTYSLPTSTPEDCIQTNLLKDQRIVAFGDVHGDINALKNFLITARIMDPCSTVSHPIWSGGNTIAIQCGDILDRGDDELACFATLASLAWQAREHGGQMQLLHGNHESLNAMGLFQYANPDANKNIDEHLGKMMDEKMKSNKWRVQFAGNQPARWMAFEPGGLLAEHMMANIKVCMVVGRTVFVHAGLTKQHLRKYGGVVGMNLAARDWIIQPQHGLSNDSGDFETVHDAIQFAQNRAKSASGSMPECLRGGIVSQSPVWMRDYSSPADSVPNNSRAQAMIDDCLEELGLGVQRMVMGHTPQMRINGALKGKAWRVDVGASKGVMSGKPEVLEIIHGGEIDEDIVSILTMGGTEVPSSQRLVMEQIC